MKLAVLGASGFVGSRVIESFHLGRTFEVRAVVRRYGGLARLARFDLDWRMADACNEHALFEAFSGCDLVLHSVIGNPSFIRDSAVAAYRAAVRQRVRRLVFLSSAVVHGQKPAVGTHEDSPLALREPPYNNGYNQAKMAAEQLLLRERTAGTTELVILRPSIVFGPRSFWICETARALQDGTFAWVGQGQGICNSIYVDNLVHAIRLALTVPAIDGEAFLVGDKETVTWADLYGPVARALGFEVEAIPNFVSSEVRKTWRGQLQELRSSRPAQAVISCFPRRLKRAVKAGVREWFRAPSSSPWDAAPAPKPVSTVSPEAELLYRCDYRIPYAKAERLLGFVPPVGFADGLQRSIDWLASVGYPVRKTLPRR